MPANQNTLDYISNMGTFEELVHYVNVLRNQREINSFQHASLMRRIESLQDEEFSDMPGFQPRPYNVRISDAKAYVVQMLSNPLQPYGNQQGGRSRRSRRSRSRRVRRHRSRRRI